MIGNIFKYTNYCEKEGDKTNMNIHGKKVVLRAMELEDCELVREMFNDPEIEDLVVGWAFPLSSYSQKKWFENNYNSDNFRFIFTINYVRLFI